jgi:hypothetical protein
MRLLIRIKGYKGKESYVVLGEENADTKRNVN